MAEQPTSRPSPDPRLREAAKGAAISCMGQSIHFSERWADIIVEHVAPVLAAVETERDAWRRLAEVTERSAIVLNDSSASSEAWDWAENELIAAKAAVAALAGGGEGSGEGDQP